MGNTTASIQSLELSFFASNTSNPSTTSTASTMTNAINPSNAAEAMKYFFVRPGKRVTKTLSVLYDTHLNKGWNAVFSKEAVDTKIKLQKKQQQIINQQLIKNQMVVQEANIHNQFTEESWDIEHSNHIDQWVDRLSSKKNDRVSSSSKALKVYNEQSRKGDGKKPKNVRNIVMENKNKAKLQPIKKNQHQVLA